MFLILVEHFKFDYQSALDRGINVRSGMCAISKKRAAMSIVDVKGTNPSLKKSLNVPEIYVKMFGRFH